MSDDIKIVVDSSSLYLTNMILPKLKTITLKGILKTSNASKEYCTIGSFVYLFYNKKGELLYVGETQKHIKRRLTGDGSGSHDRKGWYKEIETIKYIKSDFTKRERVVLQTSLIFQLKPKYQK